MSAFYLYLVVFFLLCLACVLGMHRLKKIIFKKQIDKPEVYKVPWKWFLPVLGFNYLILLFPSIIPDPSCFIERTVGRSLQGKDITLFWLLLGSPLLLTCIFQKNDSVYISLTTSIIKKFGLVFINFAVALSVSLFILITAGNHLFSSHWPCMTKDEIEAQQRYLERHP